LREIGVRVGPVLREGRGSARQDTGSPERCRPAVQTNLRASRHRSRPAEATVVDSSAAYMIGARVRRLVMTLLLHDHSLPKRIWILVSGAVCLSLGPETLRSGKGYLKITFLFLPLLQRRSRSCQFGRTVQVGGDFFVVTN